MKTQTLLKWAGGKTQLLPVLEQNYPKFEEIEYYAEPFCGSCANFFNIFLNYRKLKRYFLFDNNLNLIITYIQVKRNLKSVMDKLIKMQTIYDKHNLEYNAKVYYENREIYNKTIPRDMESGSLLAALFIYLNKTCFNGLYRVNKKGEFNVPFGKYTKPRIFDEKKLTTISEILNDSRVYLRCGDYEQVLNYGDNKTFIYYDPPYKPISSTSNFNQYSLKFDDEEQIRLSKMFREIDKFGGKQLLSNSNCDLFRELYKDFQIEEINAKRSINSDGDKRGMIKELLIKNY